MFCYYLSEPLYPHIGAGFEGIVGNLGVRRDADVLRQRLSKIAKNFRRL
jgi:hypothetical protein